MNNMINKELCDFKVWAYQKGVFKEITQEDLIGHWSVLFFYPADFTFVCPTELEDLSDYYQEFKDIGCEIYSVSEDTHFVHKAWAEASNVIKQIQYPMLADPAGVLARDFGLLIEEEGTALRGSFVINPEGKVKVYEIHDLGIGRSAKELLRKVQASQFVEENGDKLCPANWKPGKTPISLELDIADLL